MILQETPWRNDPDQDWSRFFPAGATAWNPYGDPRLGPSTGRTAGGGGFGGGAPGAGSGGTTAATPTVSTAATTSDAFDAAGNFIGPSTYNVPASGGFWANLAKGYSGYKTGQSIWDSVAGLGQDAGALALGRADAREREALAQQRQDQLALERYQAGLAGTTADINQRRFGLEAPGMRAGNAVRGDILANAQDVSFSGLPPRLQGMIPNIQGGLRPSMFSPATRQLGGLLSSQALEGQQKGDTFAPLPTLPSPTPLPSGNAFDTGLTLGGTAATLAPSFWDLLSRYRKRKAAGGGGGGDLYPVGGSGSSDEPGDTAGHG